MLLRPFIHGGKDQHKSCTAHHGKPLLCPCLRTTCTFLAIFLCWVMLLHPQARSTDHGGPRTSDLSIERRRRTHFTTARVIILKNLKKLQLFSSYCVSSSFLIKKKNSTTTLNLILDIVLFHFSASFIFGNTWPMISFSTRESVLRKSVSLQILAAVHLLN